MNIPEACESWVEAYRFLAQDALNWRDILALQGVFEPMRADKSPVYSQ